MRRHYGTRPGNEYISFDDMQKVSKGICKIYEDGGQGTGFFAWISIKGN